MEKQLNDNIEDKEYEKTLLKMKSKVLECIGKYEESIKIIDIQQSQLNKIDLNLLYRKGSLLLKIKQYENALVVFSQFLEEIMRIKQQNPEEFTEKLKLFEYYGYVQIGICTVYVEEQGNLLKSISHLDQAIKLNPTAELAYIHKGNILERQKYYKDAMQNYKQALEINKDFQQIPKQIDRLEKYLQELKIQHIFNEGIDLVKQKKYQQSIEKFDQCLKINPKDSLSLFNKGLSFENLQNYEQALLCYETGVNNDSENFNFYLHMGVIYCELQEYNKAQINLERAEKLKPLSTQILFNLFTLYCNLLQYENAKIKVDKLIELEPGNYNWKSLKQELENLQSKKETYKKPQMEKLIIDE